MLRGHLLHVQVDYCRAEPCLSFLEELCCTRFDGDTFLLRRLGRNLIEPEKMYLFQIEYLRSSWSRGSSTCSDGVALTS